MVALQARSNANHGPRELFSISQVEKAFGPAYAPVGSEGCIRAWGERYLTGLKEPEFTYEQALALPQGTQEEKKERSSYIAKSFGKALEARADEWFETGTARFDDEPGKRLFPGLHLLPHPSQLDVLPDGRRGYHKQVPVSTKLLSFNSPEALSFQGFKDAIFQVNGAQFLVDYKTTKPKVDNRKNAELGKPAGWWTWMKTPEQLLGDYQWNLYQWDEYCKHGAFIPSRWVYFASQETPQARAVDVQVTDIDPDNVKRICTQLADRANVLRGHIRQWRKHREHGAEHAYLDELPKNVTNCNAFGRLCPYHVRSPGGTCAGGDDQVIPVGQLLTAPNARPIKSVTVPAFEPGAFQFVATQGNSPQVGANKDMSIRDQINQQLAQQQQQAPAGAPAPWAQPAQQAPQGFVPQGQPPAGAPPSPYGGQPFQPAPGQPGYAGPPQVAQQPPPHVGPPEYQQAPQVAPPAPSARPQAPQGFGAPAPGNPDYFSDGNGGWLDRTNFARACEYYGLSGTSAPPAPPAPPAQPAQTQSTAQESAAPQAVPGGVQAPATDPTEQYEITGTVSRNGVVISAPLTGELASAVLANVLSAALEAGGVDTGAPEPKKSRGRPKKSA